ncbi:YceI family protein [Pseudonocardia aurantiaca]|uniref:YceI family protein n=1 Tax=Pseudonocardia aurantiaca TaxID=75290 RepID=A0ABW4FMZ0_9PSEU
MTTALADELVGTYTLDAAHSRIGFSARHAMVTKVRGAFNEFEGTANLPTSDPHSWNVAVTIQAGSIDTRNEQRDGHLRGNDFLLLDEHPTITFTSTSVEHLSDSTFRVTGDLTVRGVTRPVSVDFEYEGSATDPFGNARVGFEGSVSISRKDFGITWNAALDTGGVLVSDKIDLEFEISAIKAA